MTPSGFLSQIRRVLRVLTAAVGVLMTSCALVILPDTKYSPSLTWHTITTDHFVIHFHQGEDEVARRVADLAEDVHRRLAPVFKWEPATATQLILTDTEDAVSGAATPIPYNALYINLTPPAGSMFLVNYDDWLRLVITHEYAHILHLDTAAGLNLALRYVFGRVPFVVFPFLTTLPNLWQPIWMIEGLATHEETDQGVSDRRDNAFADMILRMAALENDFPTIDQADGLDRWPAGQVPYLFGSRFYQYLAKQFGEHVPTEIGRQYAERPLAFFVGSTGETMFGTTYRQLWDNWRRLLAQQFEAQRAGIQAEGLTATTSVTACGGMILGPAVSPDGSTIAYTENSLDAFPTLRTIRIDGTGDRAITRRNSGTHTSWSPDGKTLAFSQVEIWKNYSLYSDLYLADVERGTTRRLTHGARATDPEFSPDGKTLAFVGHTLGKSRLATLDLATGAIRPLTDLTEAIQFATPRWSPDGRSLALAVWTEGRQDIALFDVETRSLRMVTRDRAMDLTPGWSRDGRTLYFTSDRTGVYNVFAYSLSDESLSQVTNVLGGAFMPSVLPDGRGIVVANYSSRGFDLHRLELNVARAKPVAQSPESRHASTTKPIPASAAISEPTATPYSPLPTLAPRFWAPVLSADEEGGQYGLTTGGLDVLGYHKYSLTALYGTSSHRGSYVFNYRFDRLYPSFDVSVSDVPTLYGDFFRDANGNTSEYWERRQRLDADIVLPVFKTRRTQALSIGYRRERLSNLSSTPPGTQPPAVGDLNGIRVAWRYNDADEFGYSISPEGGRRLVATFQRNAEAFGSDFDTARYAGAWYEYLNLPYLRHHVLAVRAVGGVASGDVLPQRTFQLGGPALSEGLLEDDASTVLLRGYRARTIRGQRMAVGSLEYRFPIWNIERGFTTKPFFFHRVHGALFVDSGNAWDTSQTASDYKTGVGAELGTDMTFAYRARIRLRIGFAVGLDQDGVTQGYFSAGHAF